MSWVYLPEQGGLLASRLLGWRTICAVEIDPYCQRVLAQRQLDGHLDPFPIWDDVRTFDGRPWRGLVDVVSGGFPCQDISAAGRGAGLAGSRSGLWFEQLRIIGEVRPAYVFAENSPMLRTRGLGTVLRGLADLGYDACWGVLGASHVGAPHRRNRMWLVAADTDRERPEWGPPARGGLNCTRRGAAPDDGHGEATPDLHGSGLEVRQGERGDARERRSSTERGIRAGRICPSPPDADGPALRVQQRGRGGSYGTAAPELGNTDWWRVHRFAGVDDGMASRVDRVRATGNGQVPLVAALAWELLA